jgi:hypothetical protein
MLFKALTCVLALLVLAEGGYIFLHHQPINRFKLMDDEGYVAFDTVSGQLCKTFQSKSPPNRAEPSPSSDHSAGSSSGDPILDSIQNRAVNPRAERGTGVEFILKLPTCRDIETR